MDDAVVVFEVLNARVRRTVDKFREGFVNDSRFRQWLIGSEALR